MTGGRIRLAKIGLPDRGPDRGTWHEAHVLEIGDTHRVLFSYSVPVAVWDGKTLFLADPPPSPTTLRQMEAFREALPDGVGAHRTVRVPWGDIGTVARRVMGVKA